MIRGVPAVEDTGAVAGGRLKREDICSNCRGGRQMLHTVLPALRGAGMLHSVYQQGGRNGRCSCVSVPQKARACTDFKDQWKRSSVVTVLRAGGNRMVGGASASSLSCCG